MPELHRAAAAWHEEHGSADDAVRHALAAGEDDWAARLVERDVEALLRRSEGATLRRWLGGLPAESVQARARLCLAQAITAVVGSQVEAIEPLLVQAERAFSVSGDEPHEPSVGRALSVLANVPASIAFLRAELARLRGDAERAVACDQQALAHLGEGDWLLRSMVAWNLAVAEWLRGRLEPAEHALAEVVAERQAAGEGYLAMRVCYDLGQVQRAQGRLDAALATYRRGLEPANETGSQLSAAGIMHVGLAEVLYEQDELARRPRSRDPRRRAVPAARLHPAAGHRPCHPGPDPAGAGRCGRGTGRDRPGRAGRAEPGGGRPVQPGAGVAGRTAARPRRGGRGRPLGQRARARSDGRAELSAGGRVSGAGAGAARRAGARPGVRAP